MNANESLILNEQPELATVQSMVAADLPADGLYHVIVLSNFARGFDKYSLRYDKSKISESSFPDKFFVLKREEILIGVEKASRLLAKLNLKDNRLVLLRVNVGRSELRPNLRTGLGRFVERSSILFDEIYLQDLNNPIGLNWLPAAVEVAMNSSLMLLYGHEPDWQSVAPRSVSVLPIALGCQAKCNFCFSKASVSSEQRHEELDLGLTESYLSAAKQRGAQRAVITGGGEPGLLPFDTLESLVKLCATHFEKVALITNGYSLAKQDDAARLSQLHRLHDAGLTVLSVSRHHHQPDRNVAIMSLETGTEKVSETWSENRAALQNLAFRLICVLQKQGIATQTDVANYIGWAKSIGVQQVCFKELYVSTSVESVYHDSRYNSWSRQNQVPLKVVLDWAKQNGGDELFRLPWGSPVYRCSEVDVAAYTEPSVFWELREGICRSWNVMADGKCFASLEDRKSQIDLANVQTTPAGVDV